MGRRRLKKCDARLELRRVLDVASARSATPRLQQLGQLSQASGVGAIDTEEKENGRAICVDGGRLC
jgi:hypothetical protein